MARAMKSGIGSAAIVQPNGLVVAALAAVNAYGDVIDPATGAVVAGVRTEDGRGLADLRRLRARRRAGGGPIQREHDARGRRDQRDAHEDPGRPRSRRWRRTVSRARSGPCTRPPTATRCSPSRPGTREGRRRRADDRRARRRRGRRGHRARGTRRRRVRPVCRRPATSAEPTPSAMNRHLVLLLAYLRPPGRRRARASDGWSGTTGDFFVAGRRLPGVPALLDDARGEHRRGIDGGSGEPRLPRRARRVVVERIGGPRIARAGVLGRAAPLAPRARPRAS